MFTSVRNKKYLLRVFIIYIGIAAFIALFGGVYEQFSHGVMSKHMIYAYHMTLGFGVLGYLILLIIPFKRGPGIVGECVYNTGVALITTRSVFMGVLEIYGKTNDRMVIIYTVLSILFLVAGAILFVVALFIPEKGTEN